MANRKNVSIQHDATSKNAFQIAVENTEDVKNGYCQGKQAIKNADRTKIEVEDPQLLQGSLDIDNQVKMKYPRESRWDYALSYDDKLYYIEVHPAETSEIDQVISKVKWLKNWLKTKAAEIDNLPKAEHPYIWIQSGRYGILPMAKVRKKLSVAGLITQPKLSLK